MKTFDNLVIIIYIMCSNIQYIRISVCSSFLLYPGILKIPRRIVPGFVVVATQHK